MDHRWQLRSINFVTCLTIFDFGGGISQGQHELDAHRFHVHAQSKYGFYYSTKCWSEFSINFKFHSVAIMMLSPDNAYKQIEPTDVVFSLKRRRKGSLASLLINTLALIGRMRLDRHLHST